MSAGTSGGVASIGRHVWPTIFLGSAVATLYLAFVRYGFNLDDEGNLLYQILRTYRGELPYIDFHTGYTPATFYLNAWLMDAFGVSVIPLRLVLVAVNTLSVLLIFRLALRVAPLVEAALAALVYALFLPFFAGQFASFNIPYPAWYAVAAWLLTQLASVKAWETNRRGWLLAAGAFAGVAFSFKPNTGVMALAAVVLARLLTTRPLAGRGGAWLEGLLLLVAAGGVFAVLTFEVFTEQFAFLGLPILVLLVASARLRARSRAHGERVRPVGEGVSDALAILAGFVPVVGLWLAYFLPLLGLERFGREILLLGAGVERIYLLYYPDVSGWTVGLLLGVGAAWCVPYGLAWGWFGMGRVVAASLLGLAVTAGALALFGLAPEGLALSVSMQLENFSFFAIPLLLSGVTLLVLQRIPSWLAGDSGGTLGVVMVLLVYALFLFLQLYPRIDFMHVVIGMPSALVLAAGALYRLERLWWRRLGDPAVPAIPHGRVWLGIRTAAFLPLLLGLGLRTVPLADARLSFENGLSARRMSSLPFSAMPIHLERDRDHDLRELAAVARFVKANTQPGEAIVTFPALAIVPYLADRTTPVAHDYFFAGRPSHADEAEMVEQIAAAAPALVVTLNDRLGYFSASPAYYFILREFVLENYEMVRRFGRFDVLVRRDLLAETPEFAQPRAMGEGNSMAFARGRYREELRGGPSDGPARCGGGSRRAGRSPGGCRPRGASGLDQSFRDGGGAGAGRPQGGRGGGGARSAFSPPLRSSAGRVRGHLGAALLANDLPRRARADSVGGGPIDQFRPGAEAGESLPIVRSSRGVLVGFARRNGE